VPPPCWSSFLSTTPAAVKLTALASSKAATGAHGEVLPGQPNRLGERRDGGKTFGELSVGWWLLEQQVAWPSLVVGAICFGVPEFLWDWHEEDL
jgi:hypothetical protein